MQDYALILGTKEVSAEILDCIGMGLPGVVGKARALVHCIGNLRSCGLLQEVQFSNDAAIVPFLPERSTIQVSSKNG